MDSSPKTHTKFHLSQDQINEFEKNGVLVVDNVFDTNEIDNACKGLSSTLHKYGVDTNDLLNTGHQLKQLSSTNGSGGVLDIFYPEWKLKLAMNPKFFSIISQLWEVSFHHQPNDFMEENEMKNKTKYDIQMGYKSDPKAHPFGPFDCSRGYIYMDRIGYRIPTQIAEEIGKRETSERNKSNKKKRGRPIQRSLTPHLDCCPETILNLSTCPPNESNSINLHKWRPLQSFISLTDNQIANTGGFEAAPCFHHEFIEWAQSRKPTSILKKGGIEHKIPPPCIGQYTHIRPREDLEVMSKVQPIPCKAGSVVIWDNRIPHSNSRRNDSNIARAVVYASFLPDVELNRKYVGRQLKDYLQEPKRIPTDQWIVVSSKDCDDDGKTTPIEDEPTCDFTTFERKLMGMDSWD